MSTAPLRSVRESFDLWHPPGTITLQPSGEVVHEIAPPLVDCPRCLTMERGESVLILEANGPARGTIRFQAVKTKLSPAQERARVPYYDAIYQILSHLRTRHESSRN